MDLITSAYDSDPESDQFSPAPKSERAKHVRTDVQGQTRGYVAKRFRSVAATGGAGDARTLAASGPLSAHSACVGGLQHLPAAGTCAAGPSLPETPSAEVPPPSSFGEPVAPSAFPIRRAARLSAHSGAINVLRWSPRDGKLLASAAMDKTIKLWECEPFLRMHQELRGHTEGVRDVQWSVSGSRLLTASFDKTSAIFDASTGILDKRFRHENSVMAVRLRPAHEHTFLSGTSMAELQCWDTRSGMITQSFKGAFGQVQDVEFLDENTFVSSSEVTSRGTVDKTLLVWDLRLGCVVSSQIYMEAYSAPAIRLHPHRPSFIAQSNGNYIAIFSSKAPFKMNKHKRFEGHQVSGFRVLCGFSPDGEIIGTGSADGAMYFYSWAGARLLKTLRAHEHVCSDVAFHPARTSFVASCSWSGELALWSGPP